MNNSICSNYAIYTVNRCYLINPFIFKDLRLFTARFYDFSNSFQIFQPAVYARPIESIEDIQNEIKTWVVNKGIGETVLHKAARLGYLVSISQIFVEIQTNFCY